MVQVCHHTIPSTFINVLVIYSERQIVCLTAGKGAVGIAYFKIQLTAILIIPNKIKNAVSVEVAWFQVVMVSNIGIQGTVVDKNIL